MKKNLTVKELKALLRTDIIALIAGIIVTIAIGSFILITEDMTMVALEIGMVLAGLTGIVCSIKGIFDRKLAIKKCETDTSIEDTAA